MRAVQSGVRLRATAHGAARNPERFWLSMLFLTLFSIAIFPFSLQALYIHTVPCLVNHGLA
jgi:hypothetical protein